MRIGFPTVPKEGEEGSWVELYRDDDYTPDKTSLSYLVEGSRKNIRSVPLSEALNTFGDPGSPDSLNNHRDVLAYYEAEEVRRIYHTIEYYIPEPPSDLIYDIKLNTYGPSSRLAILLAFAHKSLPQINDKLVMISASFAFHRSGLITIDPLNTNDNSWVSKWKQVLKSRACALMIHQEDLNDFLQFNDGLQTEPITINDWEPAGDYETPVVVTVSSEDLPVIARKLDLSAKYFPDKKISFRRIVYRTLITLAILIVIISIIIGWRFVGEGASECEKQHFNGPSSSEADEISICIYPAQFSNVFIPQAEANCETMIDEKTNATWLRLNCLAKLYDLIESRKGFKNIDENQYLQEVHKTLKCTGAIAKDNCPSPEKAEKCCSEIIMQYARLQCYNWVYLSLTAPLWEQEPFKHIQITFDRNKFYKSPFK